VHEDEPDRATTPWNAADDERAGRAPVIDAPDIRGDGAAAWLDNFGRHDRGLRRKRRLLRALPSNPRCKLCHAPFAGVGRLLRYRGYAPSRKNPTLCATCIEAGPKGGFETQAGILFADVRGYTSLSERLPPGELATLLNRFYAVATDVLVRHDAIVDKLAGDAVMAIFWPPLVDGDHLGHMVASGEELLRGVGYGGAEPPWLPLGVGMHFGEAYMGNVGSEGVQDFTALGDVVNVASRLQSAAAAGQMLVSDVVHAGVRARYSDARAVELELKGKSAPVRAWIVDATSPVGDVAAAAASS
jgi:adenylate cyclase